MRWDNLTVAEDERSRLPGYRQEAVVRRFEAPEALDMRFYEVQARSVLNRVPERSRMPFRWTVNPYRGCSHACTYCLGPDTRVLLADGRTRAIARLRVGDAILGTVKDGPRRRLAATEVLDRRSTVRPAWLVTLADGRELIASEDHRFLTQRGWKHVFGAVFGPHKRAHLTPTSRLLGPGCYEPEADRQDVGAGDPVLTTGGAQVRSVRRLDEEMELYDITTGTGDFVAEGVISHNCFARPTHAYLGFGAGRDFEREIVVKVNAPEVLRAELARSSWRGEHVALGTNTDPYQWVEGRYRLMEGIWEAMLEAENPCSILTKSPLLLRDLDLMAQLARRTEFTACMSIPTLDEKAWRATEPHTPNPRARLEAVAALNEAGIPTGVLIAPLMPGINDAPQQIEPLLEQAARAGARNVAGAALHLRGEVRQVFMGWLESQRPDLVGRYRELYRHGAYAPQRERERLSGLVRRGGPPGAFWRPRPARDGRGADDEAARKPARPLQQALF